MKKLIFLITLVFCYYLTNHYSPFDYAQGKLFTNHFVVSADWPMAGANPERTSWTPDEAPGNLTPQWYKIFDAYIAHLYL